MAIRKRRIAGDEATELRTDGPGPDGSEEEPALHVDDDVEVLEYDLVGAQFTIDAVVARLQSDGVEIVRSSPFYLNVQLGGIARLGEHKLIFKAEDREAVGDALRDAGLV